jgi:IS605 OrfB family transposase
MKFTRIAYSQNIAPEALSELREIALRLAVVRRQAWQEFCSFKGIEINFHPGTARDMWMAREQDKCFNVPARLWKQTQRDVLGDIKAYYEASLEKLKDLVNERFTSEEEKNNAYWHIWIGKWWCHSKLHRWMRKVFKHGHTQVNNQISLDSCSYKWVKADKNSCMLVQGLTPRQRIHIPLNSNRPISGTSRLIIRNDRVEVHYTVEVGATNTSGNETIGLDKGYTEVFTDSEDSKLGIGLGKLLSNESDYRKIKGQRRNKLRAIAAKAEAQGDKAKAVRIQKNNLGNIKWNKRCSRHKSNVKTIIYRAVHQACNKASRLIVEDLTSVIKSQSRGKNTNRRLSGWVKGLIQQALDHVTTRRGTSVVSVNAAYTSQVHHSCGCLGRRMGERFYCAACRVVEDADGNAARVIKQRPNDPQIGRWDDFTLIEELLLNRTAHRLGLPSQDSRHVKGELLHSWREFAQTLRQPESELPVDSKRPPWTSLKKFD